MNKKIIGVTVGTPISVSKIANELNPATKGYVEDKILDLVEGKLVVKEAQNAVNAEFANDAYYATSAKADYYDNDIHETYATKNEVAEQLGNVDAMLDYILAKQNSLIGGDA